MCRRSTRDITYTIGASVQTARNKTIYLDTLRLSVSDRRSVADELDRRERNSANTCGREQARHPYSVQEGILLQVENTDGRIGYFRVEPYNLSNGGACFLHGGFLYSETRCHIELVPRYGERAFVTGRIVRCDCVRGKVHEVGVKFDKEINVEEYVDSLSAAGSSSQGDGAQERIDKLVAELSHLLETQDPGERTVVACDSLCKLLTGRTGPCDPVTYYLSGLDTASESRREPPTN